MTENSTLPTFVGLLIMIAIPAIVISYLAMKIPMYAKPVGVIFILAFGAGIGLYITFGFQEPNPYLISSEVEEIEEMVKAIPEGPLFTISMLAGSDVQGAPDYDPDEALVPQGHIIEWVNDDAMSHTATSSVDFGETFDTGLLNAGESYKLDTSKLDLGEYEYMCIVHPWMVSTIIIEEPAQ
tara:strand:- start:17 stop:562 length:546 start_codon:yes stop_codon:yes gene_type:complete